jgi:pyruvate dehydrogenase phosphatase
LFSTAYCDSAQSSRLVKVPIDKSFFLPTTLVHDPSVSSCKSIASHTYSANNPSEDRIMLGAIKGWSYGGVFDGHGGWQVSDVASQVLLTLILQRLTASDAGHSTQDAITRGIIDSFEEMEDMIVQSLRPAFQFGFGDLAKVGSCVLVALKKDNALVIANCGDCRAVLGTTESADLKSRILSTQINHEHNCRHQLEQQRLLEAHPNEPDLVVCKNSHACYVKGRLQLTRSLGDVYLKYHEFNGDKSRLR